MRPARISLEGWAAIYELIQSGVAPKAVALEFGIDRAYMQGRIAQLEREGIR